jgi:hypothetical protein
VSNDGRPVLEGLRRAVLSIRARLILLAALAIVPLIGDRIHDAEIERADRIEAAHKQVLELAQRGANDQADLIETTRAFLQVVARSHATFSGSSEVCGRFLASLITGLPWAKAISVIEPNGKSSVPATAARSAAIFPTARTFDERSRPASSS